MKNKIIAVIILFILSFCYLHQKINIDIQAYQFARAQHQFQQLAASRDYLLYRFSQETSLDKVNSWVKNNNFQFADKEKVLALNIQAPEEKPRMSFASLRGIFKVPFTSQVLAEEQSSDN
jgi:hypothetical protein